MLTQQAGAAHLTVSWLLERLFQVSEVPAEKHEGEEPREASRVSQGRSCMGDAGGLFPASSRMWFQQFLILIRPFAVNESLQILQSLGFQMLCAELSPALLRALGWRAGMSHSHFSRRR